MVLHRFGRAAFVLLVCLCWTALHAAEGDVQPVPKLQQRITDLTATLSDADEARIESSLRDFERSKGAQLAVLIVPTTQPEPIFDYALRVAESWKIGRKGVDDGVLFVIAKNDRKMQILTGPGIQGVLTDAVSKRIIAEIVAPRFRAGDFAGGIADGVDKIIDVVEGESLPPPPSKKKASTSQDGRIDMVIFMAFAVAAVVGPLMRKLLGRFVGASMTGGVVGAGAWWLMGGWLIPLVAGLIIFAGVLFSGIPQRGSRRGGWSSGSWSSGSSGWSGGSSDSFSGGGGSFDGGGASGDW